MDQPPRFRGPLHDRLATPRLVADELTERDALTAHLNIELGLDREDLANPWAAARSSALAFATGAVLPLAAILIPPAGGSPSPSSPCSSACR